jgi:hypothetical protein
MSIMGKALAEGGTPTYVTRFDGVRVPATSCGNHGSLSPDVA